MNLEPYVINYFLKIASAFLRQQDRGFKIERISECNRCEECKCCQGNFEKIFSIFVQSIPACDFKDRFQNLFQNQKDDEEKDITVTLTSDNAVSVKVDIQLPSEAMISRVIV